MDALSKIVEPDGLVLAYERGRNEIVLAASVDQVKKIRDQAEALRRYWGQRHDRQMEAACSAIRLRADYEIGMRSKALEIKVTGRPGKSIPPSGTLSGKLATLKAAGVSQQRATENEKLTEILPPKEVDRLCKNAVKQQQVIKSSKAYLLQAKDDAAKAAFHRIKASIPSNLHVGDFRDLAADAIPDGSVDLVFTDPPYDREAIALYEAAAKEAARILKPGGSMICYCGHLILPDVLPLMMAHLKYYWIGAHVHDGGAMSRLQQFGIIAGFKPLLWFVKDHRGDRQTFVCDTVMVSREKEIHPWQQAMATAEHFIAGLTPQAGIVVDFMAGGGTTLAAAEKLKRQWCGFETDEKAVAAILDRMRP
jgi:SAM-dependent methyltransferase